MLLSKGGTHEQRDEIGALLKKRYCSAIDSSKVKMFACRHRHAAYHNKHCRRVP